MNIDFAVKDGFLVPNDDARGIFGGLSRAVGYDEASKYTDPLQDQISQGLGIYMGDLLPGGTYKFGNGAVGAPAVTFANDIDTGRYLIGDGNPGESVAGGLIYDWNATRLKMSKPIYLASGTAGAPGLAWASDAGNDTGWYLIGANNVGCTAGGSLKWDWNASRIYLSAVNLGVYVASPSYPLEILHASDPQLRLWQSLSAPANFVDFKCVAPGDLLLIPDSTFVAVQKSNVGASLALGVDNLDNTNAGSDAYLWAYAGGSLGGDAYLKLQVGTVTDWHLNLDNSDEDSLDLDVTDNAVPANRVTVARVDLNGNWRVDPRVYSGVLGNTVTPTTGWKFTGAAHTALTASTEINDWWLNLNRTAKWATGNITTQRAALISAPTYAFAGASTITNAATLALSGAPAAGLNATLTNRWTEWIQDGAVAYGLSSYVPPTPPIDTCCLYAADIVAGETALHTKTEHGDIIKLYQQAHIADPAGGGVQDAEARTAINAILVALENAGFLAVA